MYALRVHYAKPGEFAELLILRPDHVAVQLRYSRANGSLTPTQEAWHFYSLGQDEIQVGTRGFPIEQMHPYIKLGIDDDLDEYYEKVQ